ncbi:MAG TPA: hypothetical protein VK504_08755 [Vicinamibacterales bacterium]|nr:hypothetical protein [Vicinamibacterales bacterium]
MLDGQCSDLLLFVTGFLFRCGDQSHFEHAQVLGAGIHQRCLIPDLGLPALHRVQRPFDPRRPPRGVIGALDRLRKRPFQPFLFGLGSRLKRRWSEDFDRGTVFGVIPCESQQGVGLFQSVRLEISR